MKRLLFLLLIFSKCYSQTIITQPYLFQKYITVKDSAAIGKRLRIPIDTTINKYGIAQIGSALYVGNGSYWVISGGGNGLDSTAWHIGGDSFGSSGSIGTNDSNFVYLKTNGINRWSISPIDGRLTLGATSLRGDDFGSITTGQGYFNRVSATDYISFPPDTIGHSGYSNVISFQNGLPYYNTGGVWHSFLNDSISLYTAGFGLLLNSYQFKADTSKLLPINDSGYRYATPTQLALKLNKSDSSLSTGYVTPTVLTNDSTTIMTAVNTKISLTSLSATRNVSTGSIFTYNSATGDYNLDTTRIGVGTITGVTAGTNMTGGGTSGTVTVNADTTTGATKLATQGYVTRNTPTGVLLIDTAITTLTDGSTITWNVASQQYASATVTLAGTGRTLVISNPATNGIYTLRVNQDGTGSRTITTYPTGTKWSYGSSPILTTTANAVDIISFWYFGSSTYYGVYSLNFN